MLRAAMARMHRSLDPLAARFPKVAAGLASLEQAMDEEMPRWPEARGGRMPALSTLARTKAANRKLLKQRLRLKNKVAELQSALERFTGPRRAPRYCRNIGLE